jgi:hypothetical protein
MGLISIWDGILTFATTAAIAIESAKQNVPETAQDQAIVHQSSFSLPPD